MDDIRSLDKPTYDLTVNADLVQAVDLSIPSGEIFYKEIITK